MDRTELRLVIALVGVLYLVFGAAVIEHRGATALSLLIVASPALVVIAIGGGIALAAGGRAALVARRVEGVVAAIENGRFDEARATMDGWGGEFDRDRRDALRDRRSRLVALIDRPMPARELAYRLHLTLLERYRDDLAAPLARSTSEWPEDLFGPVLLDIARRRDARPELEAFLARASSDDARRRLVESLFGVADRIAPAEPTPEWLALLRPHRDVLEAMTRSTQTPDAASDHARRYLRAM